MRLPGLAGIAGLLILLGGAGEARPQGFAPDDSMLLATVPRDFRPLAPIDGVRDPVFGVLLGFMIDRHTGGIDGARIGAAVQATGQQTGIPYSMIRLLARQPLGTPGGNPGAAHSPGATDNPETVGNPGATGNPGAARGAGPADAWVTLLLSRDLDFPVPYKILVYHPGSFQGTRSLTVRDLELGQQVIPHRVREKDRELDRPFTIEDVRLCILEKGRLLIDVDGWVDALAGDNIDDTSAAALVIYRRNGLWYGLALGYNRNGEPRSGTLSFSDDRMLFPTPPEARSVTLQMRRILEARVPGIADRYKGW